jgi:ferredoxin--NADP+ reductase
MSLGTPERPLRVAIVGAGPSGMYAADALFKSGLTVIVDAFDRLPTPYGLLRGGVAPDHQRMKSVGAYYDRVAGHEKFSFFGNVTIGQDVSLDELRQHYDAIILSYGAETDRSLGIEGEQLPGSYAATEFVGWYNGHPDYQGRTFDLSHKAAVIIGQGNVAVDVTRILAKTVHELSTSDITANALSTLEHSKIEDIYLIGRRGPVQAAFTQLEIEELGKLDDCDVVVNPDDLILNEASELELSQSAKAQKNYAVLKEFSERKLTGKPKRIHVVFFRTPMSIYGKDKAESITFGVNRLEGDAGSQKAVLTDERDVLSAGLIFRSVGYRGCPLPGAPFDDKKCIVPNDKGQVLTTDGTPVSGLFVTGWIKRGPSGVLGTNKGDSAETVATLLAQIPTLTPCPAPDSTVLRQRLEKLSIVSFDDWKKIDDHEKQQGSLVGKPREKLRFVHDMLSVIRPNQEDT